MPNKSFEACKAKPLNIRSATHKDFVPRVKMEVGKVYRLCNIKEIKSAVPSLEKQLGEGTYYFVPILPASYRGIVIVKKPNGQLILPCGEGLFYIAHREGLYKLRSPADKSLESLLLTTAKTSSAGVQYGYVFNWD